MRRLPEQLRRSLTWDHGKGMSEHVRLTVNTGVRVHFCDPQSPWQRGTNENTNGLLRQYLLKGAGLRTLTQADLDAAAAELNGRPRKMLGWHSPAERFAVVQRPVETKRDCRARGSARRDQPVARVPR